MKKKNSILFCSVLGHTFAVVRIHYVDHGKIERNIVFIFFSVSDFQPLAPLSLFLREALSKEIQKIKHNTTKKKRMSNANNK